jgi:hypothetical protein
MLAFIVAVPDASNAPLMIKVPGKSGNVPTSVNGAVMVIAVRLWAGVGDTQLVVKNAMSKSAIAAKENLFCFI